MVYQRGDPNRGVVCLRTWNPRQASEVQSLVCRCTVGQTTNVAEDGVTTSGYGTETEYAWQIRAVGYSPVGDEVIPSNAKNAV